jgi:hypothetical protein
LRATVGIPDLIVRIRKGRIATAAGANVFEGKSLDGARGQQNCSHCKQSTRCEPKLRQLKHYCPPISTRGVTQASSKCILPVHGSFFAAIKTFSFIVSKLLESVACRSLNLFMSTTVVCFTDGNVPRLTFSNHRRLYRALQPARCLRKIDSSFPARSAAALQLWRMLSQSQLQRAPGVRDRRTMLGETESSTGVRQAEGIFRVVAIGWRFFLATNVKLIAV